ncbi:hypothetical protein C5167_040493 [Papaver somniferum]|uniref:Lipoxygenase n=1 Tax=Papaver somniferum TaxID=3469 RepID=A0A4Y7IIK5_PAPSO|nr:probable linoleate 9S-lipoxygenase 5 [Papaver somniferum]RZC47531.1 hypothetical protein C5167_040493 [Papaver somniferum]
MSCFGTNKDARNENIIKIKGKVVLVKKNLLDLNDFGASMLDRVHELFGYGVCLQLISSITGDPENEMRGKVGKEAYLEDWSHKISAFTAESVEFDVTFEWDESIGNPGAFFIKNHHHSEFFLKTLILEDVPGSGPAHFVCNSWVYPAKYYKYTRIFFANQSYLTSNTPEPLRKYREDELKNLRGDGTGELQTWDRVYDYAVYNDVGLNRPVLGGSKEFPYPRRGRTGRKPSNKDSKYETRLCPFNINIYCPRDEKFSRIKLSDFLAISVKSFSQVLPPEIKGICDKTINEFDSFEDVLRIYKGYEKKPVDPNSSSSSGGFEFFKELFRSDGEKPFKFPKADVIHVDESAWRSDEEFAREMLSGVNPVDISLLQEFPPTSKLDPQVYGDHTSSITKEHIEKNLNGLTVNEALEKKKLFVLDHIDETIPYLNLINSTSTKCYAARTVLLLQEDGTLKPLAIELSLVHPDGEIHGAVNKVVTPSQEGVEGSIWQLAKAYVAVNDSSCHQLCSHWLYTHATIEPFIIATNRQLSVLHPIYKLLQPHFRDTMNINAFARQLLVSEGGLVELVVFPSKYSMQFSSLAYKQWVFTDNALPEELIKRGMAVKDPSKPHGLSLLIEDYPYAVDGLEVWSAINDWVREYCSIYYPNDESVQSDTELQTWWEELRTQGHGDLKDEPWWPKMQSLSELTQSCTTIMWLASAYHAAVNFGQYPYAGYHPNRPTMSRRFIPEPGTPEYDELEKNPDAVYLKTISSQFIALLGLSLIETLSRHSADEIYLGQSEYPDYWTKDAAALEAFKKFGDKLKEVENKIMEMNNDEKLKNRAGPVKVPYTLLCPYNLPTFPMGLTGRGIPNSVSI